MTSLVKKLAHLNFSEMAYGGKAIDQYPIREVVKYVYLFSLLFSIAGWLYLPLLGYLSLIVLIPLSITLVTLKGSCAVMPLPANNNHMIHGAKKWTDPVTQMRILSLNFYMRPMGVSDMHGDYKKERLQDFILHHLDDFDVLCLQEMFSTLSLRRNELVVEARKRGFSYVTSSPPPAALSFQCFDAGLLILSRYPLENVAFVEFDHSCYSDSLANKGLLRASVRFGPDPLDTIRLFNTHLQASYSHNDIDATTVALAQLRQVFNLIREDLAKSQHEAVLLAGDLNLDAFEEDMYCHITDLCKPVEMQDLLRKQFGASVGTCVSNMDSRGVDVGTRRRTETEREQKGFTEVHKCLDYQLFFEGSSSKLSYVKTKIEEFEFILNPFGRLSDHSGICSVFSVQGTS
jgi:endonuclease/exonuclease/phosphatase family metal-dependent hydrolase